MRLRLAAVILAIAALAALSRAAHASCAIDDAFIGTLDVPVGCSLVVYVRDSSVTPKVIAMRATGTVDVTGPLAQQPFSAPIFLEDNACTGEGTTSTYPLTMFTIQLQGAVEGDQLVLEGLTSRDYARVVPAGSCAAPIEPQLACPDDTPEPCGDDTFGDDCSAASGPSSLWVVLAVLGVVVVRRRRR